MFPGECLQSLVSPCLANPHVIDHQGDLAPPPGGTYRIKAWLYELTFPRPATLAPSPSPEEPVSGEAGGVATHFIGSQ